MGPEAKNVLPSAINFKKKLWRPIAALAVMLSVAVVYDESQPLVNHEQASLQNQVVQPKERFQGPYPENSLTNTLNGSFTISDLQESQQEISLMLQLSKEKLPESPITQENQPSAPITTPKDTGDQPGLSRITGYYCEQIPGYPIGDGGGYCTGTASGEQLRAEDSAACGAKWPMETKLQIEGYKQVTCIDTGYLAWDQVDVWFPTNKDLEDSNKPQWAKITVVENPTE